MGTRVRWTIGMVGLSLALAGCAASGDLPFQPRAGTSLMGYGYSEVTVDASHYSVSYSDNDAQSAGRNLEKRAAQLAQGAGFQYFQIDKRDNTVVQKKTTDLDFSDVNQRGPNRSAQSTSITSYYYAIGQVALLTDEQAKGNPQALQVSEVLARS